MSDLLSPASEVANNVERNAQEVRILGGGISWKPRGGEKVNDITGC